MANSNTDRVHPHVLPLGTYLLIGSLLLSLTAFTVYISFFNFGAMNLVIAMAVAATKATMVALYFMHLKYDKKIFSIIFVGALLFLAIFITFTMLDTLRRDDINSVRGQLVVPDAVIYHDDPAQDSAAAIADSNMLVDSTMSDSAVVDTASSAQSSH